jgi:hypothetical protein
MKWNGVLTAVACASLAALATAQIRGDAQRTRMNQDPAGGVTPTVGDSGSAICFGDGTGAKCGGGTFGATGHGCENSLLNGGAIFRAHGMPKISDDSLELDAASLPFSTTAIYLQANKLANGGAGYTFGDGVMCLGGSVRMIATKRTFDGYTTFPMFGDPPIHIAGKVSMLEPTQYYQVMYRDTAILGQQANYNLTNAWQVVWAP